jgi:SAM-dependent methyltransferase
MSSTRATRSGSGVQSAAVHGWGGLWAESVKLGLRHLARDGYRREAVVRVVVPLDPSRYLELPWALEQLGAKAGERVLDLAGPKLLSVVLARRGVRVTAVDQLEREIETWHALAGDVPGLDLRVADGRSLPFEDASFDHAYSISVLEHIEEPGEEEALRELARVVRPGGRVLVTLPHAQTYREDWRDAPVYANEPGGGRSFFQRWYDPAHVDALIAAAAALELVSREVVRMSPNWNDAYVRSFPWLVALGPFYGLLGREVEAADGDVVRLAFLKR